MWDDAVDEPVSADESLGLLCSRSGHIRHDRLGSQTVYGRCCIGKRGEAWNNVGWLNQMIARMSELFCGVYKWARVSRLTEERSFDPAFNKPSSDLTANLFQSSHVGSQVENLVPAVICDQAGEPLLPLTIDTVAVINLRRICEQEHFHTEEYIFPVGCDVIQFVDTQSRVSAKLTTWGLKCFQALLVDYQS